MQELDTIAGEECDYRIGHESCPPVCHDTLQNTKAGDNVAEYKVVNRGRVRDLKWLGFNPLGKEIDGYDEELMLLRGMGVNDAVEVYRTSSTWSRFNDRLQQNVRNVLHWSVSLAILTTFGESNTVLENGRPVVAVTAD